MTEIEQFQFGDQKVRVIDRDGEPWWVARDVCDVLEISRTNDALSGLDDDEKGADTIRTPGGDQSMAVINESGLYSLIMRSRKPEAKAFRRWVTHEVLPAIRRTGRYESVPVNIELTINALAEMAHNEHVVPGAARILAHKRWRNSRKGIEAFVQLTLDVNLPALGNAGKKEIGGNS